MSKEYDEYLRDHIMCVQIGFNWIEKNLPELLPIGEIFDNFIIHDDSKTSVAEYDAYDQYFYGGNNEDKDIKDAFDIAWLHHIHENPHHWQHFVLFEDEGGANKPKALPMPYRYILEMICDWWAFSWKSGNLYEVFEWYKDHEEKMLLEAGTKKKVNDILDKIREKLIELGSNDGELMHHGTKGMHWGVKNGPPYPIDQSKISYTTKPSNLCDRNDLKTLDKYESVIVGEIHNNSMVNYYDKLLLHRKPEYFICEFADEDRCLDQKTLEDRMKNATDGSSEGIGADYQYNYWCYELAHKYGCKLIGCNLTSIDRTKIKTMDEEDKVREKYMLDTLKEFEGKNYVCQLGDHHLRSIPITKDFCEFVGDDMIDDRGIVSDITTKNSSPIWEYYKNSKDIAICREKDEWQNEDSYNNVLKKKKK